jgi:hypothetical protein
MVTSVRQVYQYGVDDNDVLTYVDQWWVAFAEENRAIGLVRDSVVGHSIWEFIADEPTRQLYRELHSYVRSTGKPIQVPFRCDSPTLQRFMQLKISRGENGHLQYESTLLRTVPQRRLSILSPRTKRSNAFLTMCSVCKRSLIEPSGWIELGDISLRLRMYDQQRVPELRYTVCPDCSRRISERQ